MLSEEVYLGQFGKDRLAAMSQEQLEDVLARAKQRVIEFEEAEKERERQFREEGIYTRVRLRANVSLGRDVLRDRTRTA